MFKEKFGLTPKKVVTFDGNTIKIGKYSLKIEDINCIYVRPFNMMKNEWGSVYFSLEGEDYKVEDVFKKNVFKYTKKQTSKVQELLSLLDVEIIEKDNDLNETRASELKEAKRQKNAIICPHCKSTDVQFMQNNRKSFSVGKAAAGAALTGGIGTLAGFAGKKGKNQFFCNNCNQVFERKA